MVNTESWLEGGVSPRLSSHTWLKVKLHCVSKRHQGKGRAIYCTFIAWVACPEPAGGTELGAQGKVGQQAHTMHPLCQSPSWQECSALLTAPEISSLGFLRGGAACGPKRSLATLAPSSPASCLWAVSLVTRML